MQLLFYFEYGKTISILVSYGRKRQGGSFLIFVKLIILIKYKIYIVMCIKILEFRTGHATVVAVRSEI